VTLPTVGLLIRVPPPFGPVLDAYRRSLEGRLEVPAHITLVPPTEVPEQGMEQLLAAVGAVARAHPPFVVHVRGTGTFRPVSPVVFAVVVEGISACEALEADLRCGALAGSRRFPYHPHVTLAHDVPPSTLDRAFAEYASFEAHFEVSAFSLYRGNGEGWHSVAEYPLTGGGATSATRRSAPA
jgi:2'-5' RNA ligase